MGGCALGVVPQSQMSPRLAYQGFSFERPPSASWFIRRSEETPTRVLVRRHVGDEPLHSFYALVALGGIERQPKSHEELAELARPGPDNTGYRIERKSQTQTLTTRQGQWCIRFEWHDVRTESPIVPDVELTTIGRGYRCQNPTFPSAVVHFSWSERGLASQLDPAAQAEGDQFLEGVRIDVAPDTPAQLGAPRPLFGLNALATRS
jgi:hypothetical protein